MADLIEHNDQFLHQIMRHEGSKKNKRGKHVVYRDTVGVLTIGYGHNLMANPIPGIGEDDIMDEDEARALLDKDLQSVAAQLDARLPWWRQVGEARSAVLLNMAFNMGVSGLLGFKNTLRAVKEGRWQDARNGMLASKWASDVGRRAPILATQMLTGEWQGVR